MLVPFGAVLVEAVKGDIVNVTGVPVASVWLELPSSNGVAVQIVPVGAIGGNHNAFVFEKTCGDNATHDGNGDDTSEKLRLPLFAVYKTFNE